MSFHNPQLPIEQLPRAASLEFEALSPRYPLETALQNTIGWLIPIAILTGTFLFNGDLQIFFGYTTYAVAAVALLMGVSIWLSVVAAKKKRLAARQHDVAYQKGIIWKRTVVLPVSRIQHVELSNGPFERLFGHSTLKFFTAGGSQVDLKIPGLQQDRAEQLRQWLLQRIEEESRPAQDMDTVLPAEETDNPGGQHETDE